MLRKYSVISVVLVGLMLLPMVVHAQEPAETSTWRWPETGLRFEYPADWSLEIVDGFEFVLHSSDDVLRGMGLQIFPLQNGDTVTSAFESIAEELEVEAETIELGDVTGMRLELPEDSGRQSLLVGYSPDETNLVLMSFSTSSENWEAFSSEIDQILTSASVTLIDLDTDTLNEQMLANFEADETLTVGDVESPVRIVEVLDFSCPHCGEYASSINRLIQDYVSAGDVKLEFRTVTFVGESFSVVASNAAYCAASLGFGWDMHELLFDLRHTVGMSSFTNDNLTEVVNSLETDTDGFAECLEEGRYVELVLRDDDFAETYDIQGTPTIMVSPLGEEPGFINGADGQPIRGGIRLLFLYEQIDGLLPTR